MSWERVVRFCNQLSALHDLTPAYIFSGGASPQIDLNANGYRLLSEEEWVEVAPLLSEEIERTRARSHQRYLYEREHNQRCLIEGREMPDSLSPLGSEDRSLSRARADQKDRAEKYSFVSNC